MRMLSIDIFLSPGSADLAVSSFDDGYIVISDTINAHGVVTLPREEVVKLRDLLNAHLEKTT